MVYLGDKIYKYDNFSKRNFFLFLKKYIYLALLSLSCGMWDLVPWPGIEPETWAFCLDSVESYTREVPQREISINSDSGEKVFIPLPSFTLGLVDNQ